MSTYVERVGCLAFCVLVGTAGLGRAARAVGAPGESFRAAICLNGTWEIAPGAPAEGVPTAGWKKARVPARPLTAKNRPTGIWYRKSVRVPASWARGGRRFFLEIEKIGHYGAVYCNGKKLGEHWNQSAPFEVELTGALKPGQKNDIAVYAHIAEGRFARPGGGSVTLDTGHSYRPAARSPTLRNWVGIAGDITLYWRPAEYVADVFVVPSFRKKHLEARVTLAGKTRGLTCRAAVFDGDRKVLDLRARRGAKEVRLDAAWSNATPWMPPMYGKPKLYWLRTELVRGGKVVDRVFTRFGFREVWVEGKKVLINGKRLWIMGTYNFWHYPVRYNNDRRQLAVDIKAMLAAGITALHGHWDDLGRPTLDVCDEMGMLNVSAYFCDGQLSIKPTADDKWPEWALATTHEWARARRMHPCVVLYRPYCGTPKNVPRAWRTRMLQIVREEDGTVPITNGVDIRDYSQGLDDPGDRMAGRVRSSNQPVITNEIWGFGNWQRSEPWLRSYFRAAWDSGSVGLIIQFMPYCNRRRTFKVSWLSDSGPGNRDRGPQIRERANWCDPTRPAWEEDRFAPLLREITKKHTGWAPEPFEGRTVGEVLVSGAAPEAPVFLMPEDEGLGSVLGVWSAADGTAWFIVKRPGRYRIVQGRRSKSVEVIAQPLAAKPGYQNVQKISLK